MQKSNNILKFIPENLQIESFVNQKRISENNKQELKKGAITYITERELRAKDNFALQFAINKADINKLPIKIIHPFINYEYLPKQQFINHQLEQLQNTYKTLNLDFKIIPKRLLTKSLENVSPSCIIIDFNPLLKRTWLNNFNCKIYEIDGHNIIPARFISDKCEYSAATLRKKIYNNIYFFLTEYENILDYTTEADNVLKDFIKNKLDNYANLKNDPTQNVLSGLSKYLNLGFISPQRVALEIIKSNTDETNKNAFLEELIIRKELADNFCTYCKSYKSLNCIPNWAKISLNNHLTDLRTYLYDINELESGLTHDMLWNACQNQLLKEGTIHGYLRMYWAKKILEWSNSPNEALKKAIYLNNKYAYDAPSTSGYTNILWSVGGLHDRAFQDWFITGKIRRMTFNSTSKKFDIKKYIDKYKN